MGNNDEEKHVAVSVPETCVAKIGYPEFDAEDVETWFLCLEASFIVNQVKLDKHKFNAIIVALGSRAKYVHTAIAQCNISTNSDRYETLKEAVMNYFRPSESQRLTSLLSGLSLGDKKPSILLAEMRRLGGIGCAESVLLNLWLRALPSTVRSIIAAMPSTASLDEQARVADKILEAPTPEVASIRSPESTISCLEQRIEALTRRVEQAFSGDFQGRGRSRTRFDNRSSGQRKTTPSQSRHSRRWICWFHYRHGAGAHKCEKVKGDDANIPCIFYDGKIEVYTRRQKN